MRSRWVGLAEIEVLGPAEDVWLPLLLPGAVITRLVTGFRGRSDRIGWGAPGEAVGGLMSGDSRTGYRALPGAP